MATARESWRQLTDATQRRFVAQANERAARGPARADAVLEAIRAKCREDEARERFELSLRDVELATSSARR